VAWGKPPHESVTVPKLDVVIDNELFGSFNGGGIITVIVWEFGYNGIELPVDADDVGAIIWHCATPHEWRGANLVTVMPRPAEKLSNRWTSINSVHESIFANRCYHSNRQNRFGF
jgi:hypothetical protein